MTCFSAWHRDLPEDKLVLFAEVVEDAADAVSHCQLQLPDRTSIELPATVHRLPYRSACMHACL